MNVEIKELPAVTVACLRYKGPFGPAIGEFWREVFTPWQKAYGLHQRITYGVALDDPAVTAPADCRYDACVEVAGDYQPKAPAQLATLPGGRYAVRSFSGSADQIPAAWQEFFNNWLPASGHALDQRPCFERYPADYRTDASGVFSCELCIPVK